MPAKKKSTAKKPAVKKEASKYNKDLRTGKVLKK